MNAHEVRSVERDERTERSAVPPGRIQVLDANPVSERLQFVLIPQQQRSWVTAMS